MRKNLAWSHSLAGSRRMSHTFSGSRPAGALFAFRLGLAIALTLALALLGTCAHAATITIVNLDGPGEGFNDPTPAAPVGLNPGTTVGAQRLYVFQYAARIWGNILSSPVEILVDANFDPLDCDGSSAVLGSAGPNSLHSDFTGAAHPMTWYHQALANKLAGEDLDPTTSDIGATFNSDIGKPECFPAPWYLGVDGHEGTAIELLPVVLHELGHGLGFSTSTLAGVEEVFPHIYDYFLFDDTQGMHWPDMTEGQRVASAQNCSKLVWDGLAVSLEGPRRLGPKPLLRVNSPASIAGDMEVGLPSFGPGLTTSAITGNLVLANDGQGVPTNGCEAFTNAAAVNGNIALVDRGGCTFASKVKNAQNAGAIGVVVADSVPGCPALGMGGADPSITIPAVRITTDDGARLKSALLLGAVNVTLTKDPAKKAGCDAQNRVLVFTPAPYQLGSSVSHWDMSASPDLLMEPALNTGLSQDPDLTVEQFADIGWFSPGPVTGAGGPPVAARPRVSGFPNPTSGAASIVYSLPRAEENIEIGVFDAGGRIVARFFEAHAAEGRHVIHWDGRDIAGRQVAAGVYSYRLRTPRYQQASTVVVVR
jgi:hypothetical protein